VTAGAIVFGFILSATLVALAGTHLARAGDVIAARTRLGGLWVGALFLAAATSLPELTTDLAAVRLGAPDLAAGDLFGSSLANMLILALVSLSSRTALFGRAALDNGLAAALAIVLTAIAALFVLLDLHVSLLGVGPGSVVIAVVYVAGMRAVFLRSATARAAGEVEETASSSTERPVGTVRGAVARFAVATLVILVAAPFFAWSAKGLAELSGLGTTFIGTLLVGFATSLPELVTSLAAVRLGAYDLAVGNLFGSNAFNMVMFLPLDLAHRAGPLLGAIAQVHALTALVAIVLMAVGLAAIIYRVRGRMFALEPTSLLMILIYAAGIGLLYLRSVAP
jgi:cation:H+ antiporter